MLEVQAIHAYYGESHILHGVSLSVRAGQVLALIGRNGMGKTTLLRSIVGMTEVRSGRMTLDEQELTGLPPYAVARRGCAFIPEDRGIFPGLSVSEHLRLGPMALGLRVELGEIFARFPVLRERARQRADSLSGGERAVLAMARALLTKPKLLLVDEMSEGVQPNVVQDLGRLIREVADSGVAVVVVDQDARFVLRLADVGCVMEKGQVVLQGPARELMQNEATLHEYLVV